MKLLSPVSSGTNRRHPVRAQVRSEIQAMELEHEDEMEQLADGAEKKKDEVKEEEINFKTKLGKNIHRSDAGGESVTCLTRVLPEGCPSFCQLPRVDIFGICVRP